MILDGFIAHPIWNFEVVYNALKIGIRGFHVFRFLDKSDVDPVRNQYFRYGNFILPRFGPSFFANLSRLSGTTFKQSFFKFRQLKAVVYLLEPLHRSCSSRGLPPLDHFGVGIGVEARNRLAITSTVKMLSFASRLARVVDRASAREYQAERAGLKPSRDSGEPRALVRVAPDVHDERLLEALE